MKEASLTSFMRSPYNTQMQEQRVHLQKDNRQRAIEAKEHIAEFTEVIETIQTQ